MSTLNPYQVYVKKNKSGYVGYYGHVHHLKSTRVTRKSKVRARQDAFLKLAFKIVQEVTSHKS